MDFSSRPISHLLPHAEPMVLVHALVELGETWLVAAVDLSRPNLFTGAAGTPAYVALEYMAQAVAAYAGSQNLARNLPPQIGFLLGTREFTSAQVLLPSHGTALIRVDVVFAEEASVSLFECSMYLAEPPALRLASATLKVFQPSDLSAVIESLNS